MTSALPVALLAGLAAWFWVPPPVRGMPSGSGRHRPGAPVVILVATTVVASAQTVQGTGLALGLVLLGVTAATAALVRHRRRTAAADRVRDLVLAVCEGMAADLTAGQTPQAALGRAAAEWTPLTRAATAVRLGGDVPRALHEASVQPGAESLRAVAAAWEVSHRSGAGLAAALSQTVVAMRERRRTSRMVAAELASATATAHLMAVLPVGVLLLGSGVGGDPVGWLLRTPVGLGCLAVGAALAFAGLVWLQRISDAVMAS